jgi:hypothetical protein
MKRADEARSDRTQENRNVDRHLQPVRHAAPFAALSKWRDAGSAPPRRRLD